MTENAPNPVNPYQQVQPLNPSDEKLWATLIHVGGIFFGFVPALIGYIVLKDRGPFIQRHSATALNFQLTLIIASVVAVLTLIVGIGFLIMIAVYVLNIVFSVMAAIEANKGELYEYPLAIKFVK